MTIARNKTSLIEREYVVEFDTSTLDFVLTIYSVEYTNPIYTGRLPLRHYLNDGFQMRLPDALVREVNDFAQKINNLKAFL